MSDYKSHEIRIYDKYGSFLQSLVNYENDWSGVVNGKDLVDGTYFYFITSKGEFLKRGSITIIR